MKYLQDPLNSMDSHGWKNFLDQLKEEQLGLTDVKIAAYKAFQGGVKKIQEICVEPEVKPEEVREETPEEIEERKRKEEESARLLEEQKKQEEEERKKQQKGSARAKKDTKA